MKCQHNVSRIYTDLCDWVDDNGADSILASETMMEVSNLLIQTWAVYSWRLMVGDIERTEAEDFTIGHRNSDPKLEIERIYDEYMMVTDDPDMLGFDVKSAAKALAELSESFHGRSLQQEASSIYSQLTCNQV